MSSEEAAKTPVASQGTDPDDEFLKIAGRDTGLMQQTPYSVKTGIPFAPTTPKIG